MREAETSEYVEASPVARLCWTEKEIKIDLCIKTMFLVFFAIHHFHIDLSCRRESCPVCEYSLILL